MKYFALCLFLVVTGFFVGRKMPVESIAYLFSSGPEVVVKPTTPLPADSHSGDLVAQMKLDQKEAETFKDMAQAPQLSEAQIQKLTSQVRNTKYSFLLRRQAAVTLHKHLDEAKWRELASTLDPRLKEIISSNPSDLLEGYIRAAAR
jgi:hypothetical protein